MTFDRRHVVDDLVRRTLERPPPERSAFLDLACSGDHSLRSAVERRISALQLEPTSLEPADATPAGTPTVVTGQPSVNSVGELAIGSVVADKYVVEGLLGAGGMGAVYSARQLGLDRTVALKVVLGRYHSHDTAVERFRREAIAVARLRHPGIVTVFDFGIAPQAGAFLVMEQLEGQSLRAELRRHGALPLATAVAITGQICDALDAAHRAGVVHRDVKPDNIFLADTPTGTIAKILDFGIAKLVDATDLERDPLTGTNSPIGTPAYMAPEQCEGRPVDPRTDIYAVGGMLYELLTGRPPFVSDSVAGLVYQHVHKPPEPPSRFRAEIPPALESVVLKALSKDPPNRFASAAELATALAAASSGQASGSSSSILPVQSDVAVTHVGIPFSSTDAGRIEIVTAPPSNLPAEASSFVGRERDVSAARRALAESRLLSLTGPGGIGKTRLALRVAAESSRDFEDGTWLVELAPLADPDNVASSIALTIGVHVAADSAPAEALAEWARSKHALVVLDNCEHLVEACAAIATTLLRSGPRLRLLATSREPLGVEGESVRPVPPLAIPAPESGTSTESRALVASNEAVQLFAERARLAKPGFDVTDRNAGAVAALCRRLDGIPLAIELAAARVRVLSVEQLLERMEDRFRLLTGGSRSAVPRHQTLRATIDWSYGMLGDDERALLGRMSVFSGGCTLEAVEAVCAGDGLDELVLIDVLTRLVDRSLVTVTDTESGTRYGMLETIREYARERLSESGDETTRLAAHANWCIALAGEMRREFRGPRQQEAYDRLDSEHDNIRAALGWTIRSVRDAESALRLAAPLAMFWNTRGYVREGRDWTEAALALDPDASSALRDDALYGLALLAHSTGDDRRALQAIEACVEIRRSIGAPSPIARALNYLAVVLTSRHAFDEAAAVQHEALALSRANGLVDEANYGVYSLGMIAYKTGALDEALEHLAASLDGWRISGHHVAVASVLGTLGEVRRLLGDSESATADFRESIEVARRVDARAHEAAALAGLGRQCTDDGDLAGAALHFDEAADVLRREGAREELIRLVESCAELAQARGDAALAVQLLDSAELERQRSGLLPPPVVGRALGRLRASVQESLSDAGADVSSRSLTLDEALDLGLRRSLS